MSYSVNHKHLHIVSITSVTECVYKLLYFYICCCYITIIKMMSRNTYQFHSQLQCRMMPISLINLPRLLII